MRGLRPLWTTSSRIPTSRKDQQKAGSIPSRKTDRLHDLRLLPGYWRWWYRSLLRWSIHSESSQWWCSGIRHEMVWNSIVDEQNCTWWCAGKLVQIENTWVRSIQNRVGIVRPSNSSEEIETGFLEAENNGEEMHRSETQITKLWRHNWENWERWLRIAGVNVVLKEDQENAINGQRKDSVWEETYDVVSCTMNTKIRSSLWITDRKGW